MTERACQDCPLRPLPLFMAHSDEELALVQSLKKREQKLEAGATLIEPPAPAPRQRPSAVDEQSQRGRAPGDRWSGAQSSPPSHSSRQFQAR